MRIDPDIRETVDRANELISGGMKAMEALNIIAREKGISKITLYQRIRLAGGQLDRRFVLPGDDEAASAAVA